MTRAEQIARLKGEVEPLERFYLLGGLRRFEEGYLMKMLTRYHAELAALEKEASDARPKD